MFNVVKVFQQALSISEYQQEYKKGRITHEIIDRVLDINSENPLERELLKIDMFKNYFEHEFDSRIGNLRENWRIKIGVDMDALVYPTLFRLLSSYLDQGIALWKFPIRDLNFLEALRHIESNGWVSIFRRKRARKIFQEQNHTIESLLEILVGENKDLYEQYIFDQ
ncbi:MAG: putative inorganic carbon transporter subunit DabA, partial [Chitinophagales bacterium]